MKLHHPRHRAAMHWLRRGEIACGRAFDRQRNRLSASTNAMHVTCADCWRVMAAIAAADQPSKVNDELVEWVKAHAANLPRSGWRATKLRNVGRPGGDRVTTARREHGGGDVKTKAAQALLNLRPQVRDAAALVLLQQAVRAGTRLEGAERRRGADARAAVADRAHGARGATGGAGRGSQVEGRAAAGRTQ